MSSRVIVVLPAYNEAPNIANLLRRIFYALMEAQPGFSVIVVDDGSSDGTAEVLEKLRAELPLTIERHPHNLGLGASIRDGLRIAASSASGHDVIVTMDADESHDPGLMLRMVQMIHQDYDVIIASRYQAGSRVVGLGLGRRAVSSAASWLMRILFPTPGLRDYTCGYRAYSAIALEKAYARFGDQLVNEEGFQCMVDLLLKLRQLPLRFGEVPMALRYDLKLGKSKMPVVRTALNTLRLIWRHKTGR